MEQDSTFNIYVMSYKRSDAILTKHCLDFCTYVVREREEEAYRKAGVEDLLIIPEGAKIKCGAPVCEFMTTFHWIVENTPEDVIFIADDDIKYFQYRLNDMTDITEDNFKDYKERTTDEIMRIGQVLYDLNLGLAFDQPAPALYNYDREYGLKGMPGHVRWVNKTAFKAQFIIGDYAMSDVDMMMQELHKNRIILQPKYFLSHGEMYTNAGGEKSGQKELNDMRLAMKNKWGRYFGFNTRRNIANINVVR